MAKEEGLGGWSSPRERRRRWLKKVFGQLLAGCDECVPNADGVLWLRALDEPFLAHMFLLLLLILTNPAIAVQGTTCKSGSEVPHTDVFPLHILLKEAIPAG